MSMNCGRSLQLSPKFTAMRSALTRDKPCKPLITSLGPDGDILPARAKARSEYIRLRCHRCEE
jgi:hypothetical protein